MLARSLGVFVVVAAAGSPAGADPAGAERAAADAQARAKNQDFIGAAAKYREAFREQPRADFLCNVGVAYYKAKDLPRAHRYLDQCLALGTSLDPAFIDNVKKVLTAVEQKLAADRYKPLSLIVQPDAAVSTINGGVHDEPLVGSRRVWLPYGRYRITVHAEGYVDQVAEVVIEDQRPADHSITLAPDAQPTPEQPAQTPPAPLPLPTTATTALPGEPPAATVALTTPPTPAPARRSLVAPIVASAATGAFGGLALGFYLSARSNATSAGSASLTRDAYEAYADTATSHEKTSWIIGGVAGVAAVTAGVLWWRALKTPSRVEVSAIATPTDAVFALSGRW